jgi:hypothetical protein
MALADAPSSLAGVQSVRAVPPPRADDQRPFDRLRGRLGGADFLEVFAAGRFFCATTASAGVSSGNAAAGGMISAAAVSGRLPSLMKRNAAAFCASNPRRAAVKVRASQGSIGCSPMTQCDASRSQPLRAIRVPTSAANLRNIERSRPDAAEHSPNALFRAHRSKMIPQSEQF